MGGTNFEQFAPLLASGQLAIVEAYIGELRADPKPYSTETIENYRKALLGFARTFVARTGRPLDLLADVSPDGLRDTLLAVPPGQVGTRRHMKWAVRSLAAFLERRHALAPEVGQAIAKMPVSTAKGRKEPAIRQAKVDEVLRWLVTEGGYDPVERVTMAALFALYAKAGLRNAELCHLHLDDVDLDAGRISVRRGKGDKDRDVPLPRRLEPLMRLYLKHRPATRQPYFFVGPVGNALNRELVGRRLRRLSAHIGVRLNAHRLRYAFATHAITVKKAHLVVLRDILGHTKVSTTEAYVRMAPWDSVESMRDW